MSFRSSFLGAGYQHLAQLPPAQFEARALQLFAYQAAHCPPYQAYLAGLGHPGPAAVQRLQDIPFLPIEFFKTQEVRTDPASWQPQEVFRSSGTTLAQRSRHLVRDPALYRANAAAIFAAAYGPLTDWVFLALLPSYLEQGESSLVAMVADFAQRSGQAQPAFFLRDHAGLLRALAQAKQTGRRVMLFGVTYALLDLAAEVGPAPELQGLVVLETGGMKGRRREMIREELHQELQAAFGPGPIHSEYGMTELLSQAYSPGEGLFYCPPQLRVLLRDPADPFSVATGRADGAINVIDLANIDSCAFIETKDLARQHPDGSFEVLGRLDNSDIRGCSQLV